MEEDVFKTVHKLSCFVGHPVQIRITENVVPKSVFMLFYTLFKMSKGIKNTTKRMKFFQTIKWISQQQ